MTNVKELEDVAKSNKREAASLRWRIEKAGNNAFKKYFYGIKNIDGKIERKYNCLYDKLVKRNFEKYKKTFLKKGLYKGNGYYEGAYVIHKENKGIVEWDFYDIESFLITSITLKGVFHAILGNSVNRKEIMHSCWECRKKLLKVFDMIDDPTIYSKMSEEEFMGKIISAFSSVGENFITWWD